MILYYITNKQIKFEQQNLQSKPAIRYVHTDDGVLGLGTNEQSALFEN